LKLILYFGWEFVSPVTSAFSRQKKLFVTLQGPGIDTENQMELFEDGKSLFSQILNGFPYAIDSKGRIYIVEARGIPCYLKVHNH